MVVTVVTLRLQGVISLEPFGFKARKEATTYAAVSNRSNRLLSYW